MALVSPGVEVSIIDQSQYLPAAINSVPLVVLATAQNKANAAGDGVAQATTAANAGKLYQVTSQRDLVNLYGTPFFYTTTNGTPIQGYELNEYGLLAAYSVLGVTNRCYVLRADIDLASLVGQTGRTVGAPDDGTYWLDTTNTTWGIYEFNRTTGKFTLQSPIVITDSTDLTGGVPNQVLGNIGDYAVNAIDNGNVDPVTGEKTYFYKTTSNQWVTLGGADWKLDWPTIQSTNSDPSLTAGDTITFGYGTAYQFTVTVPVAPNNDVDGLVGAINDEDLENVHAANVDGKLTIYLDSPNDNIYLRIVSATGSVLTNLGGLTSATNYFQPQLAYGTSAQMPLWQTGQSQPKPTGSVWIKVGAAGTGLAPSISEYNATTAAWVSKTVGLYVSDWAADSQLDATGGQAIPAGTVYCQYNFNYVSGGAYNPISPLYFYERIATGETIVTGTEVDFNLTSGPYTIYAAVTTPGSSSLSDPYSITLPDNCDPTDFVVAWATANIPYTSASVTSDGAVQLVHTEGGEIVLSDYDGTTGQSNGVLADIGFVAGTTTGCKYGPGIGITFTSVPQDSSSGIGTGATFTVSKQYGRYQFASVIDDEGADYAVGDTITLSGADLGGTSPTNDLTLIVMSVGGSGECTSAAIQSGISNAAESYWTQLSNWYPLTYEANATAPNVAPANNTNWFYSVTGQVDIMVNYNGAWYGYGNLNYTNAGFPTSSGSNTTDPAGPICQATEPTTQSDGTALAYGDLWVDTNDLENYPVIYRWQSVSGEDQWVLIDNTDQLSSEGIVFADARWATNATTNPYNDAIPSIGGSASSLLYSDYLDLDAPDPDLYPSGMLLFNTRRSGYNVKQFRVNYFNSTTFPDASLPTETDAWVSVSGNMSNGAPYMGRKAQRAMVVESLRSVIDTNTAIRDEDNFFNLMATPNYPECQPNMVVLNADRGETGYILGDTPMRLAESATDIQAWATNAAGATSTGEQGLVTRNTYLGIFYPSGIATDLSGNEVAVPASHMMLRTFVRNDTIAYPWFAAAGTRRGVIDNALNIGYIDAASGEFITTKTRLGIRDVLYINFINPLVFFTGNGLLNYGNKTSYNSSSSLDRTNVARLIAYIRRQLTLAARPFVFEPNDALTRQQIAGVVETLMVDLVAKRGIYDYLVVCDESNNTPARIDRNELWIDVAIEPVKAAEFIYVPVRILNTGELASL